MKPTAFLALSFSALATAQSPLSVYGCSGVNFSGTCRSFDCPYQACCQLPSFFQTSLVSVRATGSWNFRLYTAQGCGSHCNDSDRQSLFVDHEGWRNIGAAAYACIDGPY